MPSLTGKIKVLFAVTNCICFDQRVLKMASVLKDMDMDVTIAGRRKGECCERSDIPFRTIRFKMIFRRGFLFYKFFNIRLLFCLLFRKFDLLVSNDLDTLPACYLAAILKRRPVVYDSHEYFTGLPELSNRRLVRYVWKTFERTIFPRLKYVITVSDSIAGLYEKEYGIRPVVIRNLAPSSEKLKPVERNELNISEDEFVMIIQGTGINIDKGCEEAVEAVAGTEKLALIIAGSGDVLNYVKEMTGRLNIMNRVKILPPMQWNELIRYTKTADAGLVLEKDTNLNYRFSLPNKLFDYISAGIPVIAADLPEISAVVTKYNCGIIIPGVTPGEISEAVELLRKNKSLSEELKKNAVKASLELNWERESWKVRDFYRNLINNDILNSFKSTSYGH